MTQLITKEEVEKIACLSHISLSETELINTMKHLDAILSYATRVQEIAKDVDVPSLKNCNVERDDVVIPTDP